MNQIKHRARSGFTLIELLITISIVVILGAVAFGGASGCTVSDGSRAGVIVKLSNKGAAFKTYEGTLLLGSGQARVEWDFTIVDKALYTRGQQAMRSGERVEVSYHQVFMQMPWKGDTPYRVTAITSMGNRVELENDAN